MLRFAQLKVRSSESPDGPAPEPAARPTPTSTPSQTHTAALSAQTVRVSPETRSVVEQQLLRLQELIGQLSDECDDIDSHSPGESSAATPLRIADYCDSDESARVGIVSLARDADFANRSSEPASGDLESSCTSASWVSLEATQLFATPTGGAASAPTATDETIRSHPGGSSVGETSAEASGPSPPSDDKIDSPAPAQAVPPPTRGPVTCDIVLGNDDAASQPRESASPARVAWPKPRPRRRRKPAASETPTPAAQPISEGVVQFFDAPARIRTQSRQAAVTLSHVCAESGTSGASVGPAVGIIGRNAPPVEVPRCETVSGAEPIATAATARILAEPNSEIRRAGESVADAPADAETPSSRCPAGLDSSPIIVLADDDVVALPVAPPSAADAVRYDLSAKHDEDCRLAPQSNVSSSMLGIEPSPRAEVESEHSVEPERMATIDSIATSPRSTVEPSDLKIVRDGSMDSPVPTSASSDELRLPGYSDSVVSRATAATTERTRTRRRRLRMRCDDPRPVRIAPPAPTTQSSLSPSVRDLLGVCGVLMTLGALTLVVAELLHWL